MDRGERRFKAEHGGNEYGEYFADIGAEQEMHGFFDIIEYSPALLDSLDYRCEIIVGQYHVGGALCYIRATLAHGAADIGGPERGGVVDAVTRHCDRLAVRPQSLDNTHLMLGRYTGKDAAFADLLGEFLVAASVDIPTRHCKLAALHYPELLRHGARR